MDEQYIRANNVVERYLLHKLSDPDRYAFERYYFEHPEIMQELELMRALRDGLRNVTSAQGAGAPQATFYQRLRDVLTIPALTMTSMATALVLGVLLVARPIGQVSRPVPIVATVDLVRSRGAPDEVQEIAVSRDGVVAVAVDAIGLDPASLRGRLRSGAKTISNLPLVPDRDSGLARVSIPTSMLVPGEYSLELQDAGGKQLAYEFRVTP